jgi:hypothetical protein
MGMTNLRDFPNLIPDSIDLSQYMEPEAKHRVRTVSHYRDGVIRHMIGEGTPKGRALPFKSLRNSLNCETTKCRYGSATRAMAKAR